MFKTLYNVDTSEFNSCSGSPVLDLFSLHYDSDGAEELYVSDSTNLYESIQSFLPSVSLDNILARYANGDTSAIDKARGFFADVSDVPSSLSEVLNIVDEGRSVFENLPSEIKERFGNSYVSFLNDPSPAFSDDDFSSADDSFDGDIDLSEGDIDEQE